LYTWGTNNNGSLLQGPTEKIEWEPKPVTDLPFQVESVVCSSTDTAVISTDGDVYVSGTNKSGQLGLNHQKPIIELTKIPDLPHAVKIALGPNNSAIITKEGDLYTCGFGGSLVSGLGCLGHGGDGEDYLLEPKLVQSLVEDGCYAQDVVLGESHMTVLTTEGEILTTGASSYGRLGNGETSVDSLYLEPVEILQNATQIAGGKSFTLALSDGVVYGWGRNQKGQLGTGFGLAVDMYSMEQVPCPIDADELANRSVTKIAAGQDHAACVTTSGELFWWGNHLHLEPVRVSEVLHTKIIDVACGQNYTMALSEDNHIYVWGKGRTGVLGNGPNIKNLNQAQIIKTLADEKVVTMSAGWTHAACLVESN
jgi:alpha-tubulin suppressor-like RCC1 family protein